MMSPVFVAQAFAVTLLVIAFYLMWRKRSRDVAEERARRWRGETERNPNVSDPIKMVCAKSSILLVISFIIRVSVCFCVSM